MRGAKMNRMGRERRRVSVGMSGEEGYEKRGIMEMGFFFWDGIPEGKKETGRFFTEGDAFGGKKKRFWRV